MKQQLSIWKFIKKSLEDNSAVMLLYVLESSGSSPGRQGFFMAVNADKEMKGSIGGGIMEHKFVEMAKEKLLDDSCQLSDSELRKQIHDKSAAKNQSGMICSGEQIIFLYRVQEKDIPHIENLISSLEQNKNGTLQLSSEGILFEDIIPPQDFYFDFKTEEQWIYAKKTGFKNHVYIIGGGHCAFAVCKLLSIMDFFIHLYEDREGLNTLEANEYAHEKTIVKDYSELETIIPSGKNNYVIVMTFGYRSDDIAVRALINKDFKYIGLLGSKKKIEKLFQDYKKDGITSELLNKIHSPIGLQIKSETPEEIAVSIAAEIIKVKNQPDQ